MKILQLIISSVLIALTSSQNLDMPVFDMNEMQENKRITQDEEY